MDGVDKPGQRPDPNAGGADPQAPKDQGSEPQEVGVLVRRKSESSSWPERSSRLDPPPPRPRQKTADLGPPKAQKTKAPDLNPPPRTQTDLNVSLPRDLTPLASAIHAQATGDAQTPRDLEHAGDAHASAGRDAPADFADSQDEAASLAQARSPVDASAGSQDGSSTPQRTRSSAGATSGSQDGSSTPQSARSSADATSGSQDGSTTRPDGQSPAAPIASQDEQQHVFRRQDQSKRPQHRRMQQNPADEQHINSLGWWYVNWSTHAWVGRALWLGAFICAWMVYTRVFDPMISDPKLAQVPYFAVAGWLMCAGLSLDRKIPRRFRWTGLALGLAHSVALALCWRLGV